MRLLPTDLYRRVAFGIQSEALLARIGQDPGLWKAITARQDWEYSPHRDTEAIFLRMCGSIDLQSVFMDLVAVDYPAAKQLMPEAGRVFIDCINAIGNVDEIGRVMIVNLKPGGHITPHVDEGEYADFYDRFHLVMDAHPRNVFRVRDGKFRGEVGELWWFNHKLEHEVWNRSAYPRIHMIMDVVAPEYRAARDVALRKMAA